MRLMHPSNFGVNAVLTSKDFILTHRECQYAGTLQDAEMIM